MDRCVQAARRSPLGGGPGCLLMVLVSIGLAALVTVLVSPLLR